MSARIRAWKRRLNSNFHYEDTTRSRTHEIDPAPAQANAGSATADLLCYSSSKCTLGEGVCAILIGNSGVELEPDLAALFSGSAILANEIVVRDDLAKTVRFIEKPAGGPDLTLDMRGTPCQRRVWDDLR